MTLDEMIQKTAAYTGTKKKVVKTNGVYSGDAAPIVDLFIDGFNTAKNKIAKEKFEMTATEEITLDETLEFYTTSLPYKLVKIKNIDADWEWSGTDVISFPSSSESDILKIYYSYVPEDFSVSDLTADFSFPEANVPPEALCYFAAALYLDSKSATDRAGIWVDRWETEYNKIKQYRGERTKTKNVYSIADMM